MAFMEPRAAWVDAEPVKWRVLGELSEVPRPQMDPVLKMSPVDRTESEISH